MATVKSRSKTKNATPKVMRLTITPEMQEVLDLMKLDFPVLSEPELFKVLLSQFYNSIYVIKKTKTTTGKALKSLLAAVSSNAKNNSLSDQEQQKIWQEYKNSFR